MMLQKEMLSEALKFIVKYSITKKEAEVFLLLLEGDKDTEELMKHFNKTRSALNLTLSRLRFKGLVEMKKVSDKGLMTYGLKKL